MDKNTEVISFRLPERQMRFVSSKRKQLGLESPAEYMRHLIERDMQKASTDLTLLADALGVNVSIENKDFMGQS